MIKILHTSDWHLGRTLHAFSLIEDQKHALNQVLTELSNNYDAILISGDIYDRAVPSPEAVTLFSWFLKEVCALQVSCVVISGNHDSAERLGFADTLFDHVGIHFRCDYQRLTEPVEIKNQEGEVAHVFALPFVETAWIRQMFPDTPIANHAQAVQETVDLIGSERNPEIPSVLMAHAFVGDSVESSDSERQLIGGAQMVDAEIFSGFDYVALGHLHKPQYVDHPWVRYSGSLLAYSFSEVGYDKHMISVQLGRSSEPTITPIPLCPLRPIHVVSDTFERLLDAPKYAPYADHYLSIRLTDDRYHINTFGQLRQRFKYLLELRQTALEIHGDAFSSAAPTERTASVTDIFDAFLDSFGWQDADERKAAKELLQQSYKRARESQREVNP